MPPAEIVTGTGRRLWYRSTLTTWLDTAPLRECPTCGAKLKGPTVHTSQSRCVSPPMA